MKAEYPVGRDRAVPMHGWADDLQPGLLADLQAERIARAARRRELEQPRRNVVHLESQALAARLLPVEQDKRS